MTTTTTPTAARPIDPVQAAADLWANLKEYQPAIAGALALHIRDLPVDWPQREFGIARPHALLTLQPPLRPGDNLMPEAAPYNPDIEECQACVEAGLICRWHAGQASAHEYWHNHVMAAIKADRDARVDDVLLHQEAEAEDVPCRCRRCAPTKPTAARRSWWRRALKFVTHSMED